jgi:hypothetical protein
MSRFCVRTMLCLCSPWKQVVPVEACSPGLAYDLDASLQCFISTLRLMQVVFWCVSLTMVLFQAHQHRQPNDGQGTRQRGRRDASVCAYKATPCTLNRSRSVLLTTSLSAGTCAKNPETRQQHFLAWLHTKHGLRLEAKVIEQPISGDWSIWREAGMSSDGARIKVIVCRSVRNLDCDRRLSHIHTYSVIISFSARWWRN